MSRLDRIQAEILDALAVEATLGAVALRAYLGEWAPADVRRALTNLVAGERVRIAGSGRSARYTVATH